MTAPHGEFLDGKSLDAPPVHVEFDDVQLRVIDLSGELRATWQVRDLRCDVSHGRDVLHVTCPASEPRAAIPDQPETLVVRDALLVQRIRAACGLGARPLERERRLVLPFVLLALLVGIGGAIYHYTPAIARFVAVRIPLEQERALGAQIESVLTFTGCEDPVAEAVLRELIAKLSGDQAHPYTVRLMHAGFPNAFALPGGVIVVTDELLHTATSADEVSGVLAHEVEHVVQRHVLAGFLRDTALSLLWSLTMGDYSGLMLIDPTTAYRITNLEFSRSDEQSADDAAVKRLHRLGYSHHGMIEFFERIQKEQGDDSVEWLSTHPSTSHRLSQLRGTPDLPNPQPPIDSDQFAKLKRACPNSKK